MGSGTDGCGSGGMKIGRDRYLQGEGSDTGACGSVMMIDDTGGGSCSSSCGNDAVD